MSRVKEEAHVEGHAILRMTGADGKVKWETEVKNLITTIGDRLYAERGAGITTLAVPTGMKLGIASATPAKSGAGSALGSYLAGSNQALDTAATSTLTGDTPPKVRITYKSTWQPGDSTHGAITEVVLVNDTIATDQTSPEANTIARILTNPGAPATGKPKDAGDTLEVLWYHEHRAA